MLGKDKSFITYLGVLKAPESIRLEQKAQPPLLLGGISSGIILLAGEAGTSPASRRSAVSKAIFGKSWQLLGQARCAVAAPHHSQCWHFRVGGISAQGLLSGLMGSRFCYF